MASYSKTLMGGMGRPTKRRQFNFMKPRSNAVRVLGSMAQTSNVFPADRRNKQCTCMSVVAICASKVVPLSSWSSSIIDGVLRDGDELFRLSIATYFDRFRVPAPSLLAADEVYANVTALGRKFEVNCSLIPHQKELPHLLEQCASFFAQHDHGVFTCNLLSVAIFKVDGQYSVFDSHSRNKHGEATDDGTALLSTFTSLEEMVHALRLNVGLNDQELFAITPIIVETITSLPAVSERLTEVPDRQILEENLGAEVSDENRDQEVRMSNSEKLASCSNHRRMEKKRHRDAQRKLRENSKYRRKERSNDTRAKRARRDDVSFRKIEKAKDMQRKRVLRINEEIRGNERAKDTARKRKLRGNPVVRASERSKEKKQKRKNRRNRKNDENARRIENQLMAARAKENRKNEFFRFREVYLKNLCDGKTESEKLKVRMIQFRSLRPEWICAFCEGLFFRHSVVALDLDKLGAKISDDDFNSIKSSITIDSGLCCRTCQRYISKGKVPKMAAVNGLKFPEIPPCLKSLSPLEERMVAPYINFMQIRPLKPHSLNPQLGLKGSVVNIPVEVNDMIQVLPRRFDEMHTVQVKLKRHISHSTDYLFETIRPSKVIAALHYLKDTPLYRKYDISIDDSYLAMYGQSDEQVNFIVDPDDISDSLREPSDQRKSAENLPGSSDSEIEGDSQRETERPSVNPSDSTDHGEQGEADVDDEVLLIDRDKEANDQVQIMAPGQGKAPVPWHLQPDLEELSFPTIFGGQPFVPKGKFSYGERAKSEARRSDRRSCLSSRILYMAKKKLEQACLSSINICLRKTKATSNLKAGHVLDKACFDSLMKHDEGFRVLSHIRASPSFWEQKKKELLAMIRQLGRPTFFLTMSAAESRWPELIQCLAKVNLNRTLSIQDVMNMSDAEKTTLIRLDPVTCARYYDHKVSKYMWYFKQERGLFNEHPVVDSYERVEFQQRGSPHEHVFLWLKNAPHFDPSDPVSIENCITFIDMFICCEYDEDNPYIIYVIHHHTYTCYKGKKIIKICRFQFPIPPMRKTVILFPLKPEDKTQQVKDDWKKIKELCEDLFRNPRLVSFDDLLLQLDMTEARYILAVRSSLKRTQVFLKRTSREVSINAYNKDLLKLFEANIDLQFVIEEFGIASYIINYISKVDAGLSKMLREAADDIKHGYTNVRDKLRNIANVFLNGNLMSSQEAAYHVLSLPLSKSSRGSVYVNTAPTSERIRMLKMNSELQKLDSDSGEIYLENIQEKYSKRPERLNGVCLADFAALYNKVQKRREEINDDEEEGYSYEQRDHRKILRYRRYQKCSDPVNYYREQLCLFLPWRDEESEIENCNQEERYRENLHTIESNRSNFLVVPDELLEEALDVAANENRDNQEEEEEEFLANELTPHRRVDILEQGGKTSDKSSDRVNHLTTPQRISASDLHAMFRKLNEKQRELVMHVLHSLKTNQDPLRLFLSGSAGVGKSTVINIIYQAVTHHFDNLPGENIDSIKVLLCAYSGKAAFLIKGMTLHSAFALPVTAYGGQMPGLSSDLASSIRQKLIDVKLLIIDEISMVGSRTFARVDQRLRQVMGRSEPFGGISVMTVGDFHQIDPVMDSLVFKPPNISDLSIFLSVNPLWEPFKLYELTEIMRQRNDQLFINALNNLSTGTLTNEDVNLLKSRQVSESEVPDIAIRLYRENRWVDAHNEDKIAKSPEPGHVVIAKHAVLGKISPRLREDKLRDMKEKKKTDFGGLPYSVTFKIGIKYMITINIDVEDGLVNGACGTLANITYKSNSEVDKIWLDFGADDVGKKARLVARDFMLNNNIDSKLVPVVRKSHSISGSKEAQYQLVRQQFPVTPAEALTIHKSQGQTYESVCVDLRKSRTLPRALLYVAFSRVTCLSGLYILGEFKAPKAPTENDPVESELRRLRQNPLTLSFWNLEDKKGLALVYHNVQSLHMHYRDVLADGWYMKSDVLILAETRTIPSDIVDLPGFKIIKRCDSGHVRAPRGLLCLVKEDSMTPEIIERRENGDNFSIDIVKFKCNDVNIISGYKSPRTPIPIFKRVMEELISTESPLIILGDFNFNIIGHEESCLLPFMRQYGLSPVLDPQSSTTNFNTQIDVIFATCPVGRRGVYDSYFSDHKAIYCECP